jgi:flavin-dependent dehydrogenase
VGLRIRLAPSATLCRALHDVIELHLFEHGYAGLLLQEDGSANLCLSVAAARLAEAGGKPEALIAALEPEARYLGERFAGATGEWSAVSGVPYGWRAGTTVPGLFRLGDQAAVIASLAGDGIAIALHSASMAARQYLIRGPAGAPLYQRAFAHRSARPLRIATMLRSLGEDKHTAAPLLALFGRVPGIPTLLARLTRIGSPAH